jgi:hypothetical protein
LLDINGFGRNLWVNQIFNSSISKKSSMKQDRFAVIKYIISTKKGKILTLTQTLLAMICMILAAKKSSD